MHAALQAATSLRFCSRFSRPYLSQIPAGVARERPRKRESAGSSLIIHHRVQPGETKMAALLVSSPSANTLSSKEDSPLRELSRSRPPRSGLTTTLFARPLSFLFFFSFFSFFPSASKRVVRASRTPTRIINFLRSMIRKIQEGRRKRERKRKKSIHGILIGE